jgi:hypothetical protein
MRGFFPFDFAQGQNDVRLGGVKRTSNGKDNRRSFDFAQDDKFWWG